MKGDKFKNSKKIKYMSNNIFPDTIFDISWEVCNKIGGIHTVLSTKAFTLVNKYNDNFILIGPDVWRGSEIHPEFEEDTKLFKSWKEKANTQGLRVRVGRWKIAGNPITILVDFTGSFSQKNEIFSELWNKYKLDSISGQWDYIEPALFGYVAGKVIESFSRFHFDLKTKIVAHFHEWMTGAGILYLKENTPNIATIFTSHSTVLGRSLAENGYHLYKDLKKFDGDSKSKELEIVSKYSLEKYSSIEADVFTTVSDITANESNQFHDRQVDIVTPNGFEQSIVPVGDDYILKRELARKKLLSVAGYISENKFNDDTILVATSGRYEFKNKGLDLFIDSLGKLNNDANLKKEVLAFIFVPANHYGPRKELVLKLNDANFDYTPIDPYLTHALHDEELDLILNRIKDAGLKNSKTDKVKVIFVPSYLNGNDGVIDLSYFDILPGLDLTIFPSYYEPWGYTPMESLAFSVPTVTTGLAGFGSWVKRNNGENLECIKVIDRTDSNDIEVLNEITKIILEFTQKSEEQRKENVNRISEISKISGWDNLLENYYNAWNLGLKKVEDRKHLFKDLKPLDKGEGRIKTNGQSKAIWHKTNIQATIPSRFYGLKDLSMNLWWTWNFEATDLFNSIDSELWENCNYNPIILLERVPYERFIELESNKDFVQSYDIVYKKFNDYLAVPFREKDKSIGYFSMEFGFHDSVKIFSGGLGILAGDYLKEASDSNENMVAFGLLYRMGYFSQIISLKGEQIVNYPRQQFSHLPIREVKDENGEAIKISVFFPGRAVYAKIWQLNVGRVKLYLLDTDISDNNSEDRSITHHLYGGNNENRLRQEMILGVGGIRAMEKMKLKPKIYHCNEGHAAFIGLERLRKYIDNKNFTFAEAVEIVRSSTLFTTHTPVPAGHDSFEEDLVRTYMSHYPERLKISWDEFMGLGKIDIQNKAENFSMSHLAINLSQEVNGVSWLHGEVSKDMFISMFPGYYPKELHISYVTNGVHYPSWTSSNWQNLYNKMFGEEFVTHQNERNRWNKIFDVPDKDIWDIKLRQKAILIDFLKKRLETNWIRRHEDPQNIVKAKKALKQNTLIIGFARRFATYKRAYLLFSDPKRLAAIVNNPDRPVIFLFAGKAHPKDLPGQEVIKMIVDISRKPEFLGKIIFLENYDIDLAKKLVQGVDVWLNTPTRPLEASGTSGMKAVMNGGLHFSVLDGWWVEGYKEKAGWALPLEKTYSDQEMQNQLDAEMIYNIFESEITPLFYERNKDNVPEGWVEYVKNSISLVAPEFTMRRMIDDYRDRFYNKLFDRAAFIKKDFYHQARIISMWKKKVSRSWDKVEVVKNDLPNIIGKSLKMGEFYTTEIALSLGDLNTEDIGLELVFAHSDEKENIEIKKILSFDFDKEEDNLAYYKVKFQPLNPGRCRYGIRMYPNSKLLPHRQDFGFVRWL